MRCAGRCSSGAGRARNRQEPVGLHSSLHSFWSRFSQLVQKPAEPPTRPPRPSIDRGQNAHLLLSSTRQTAKRLDTGLRSHHPNCARCRLMPRSISGRSVAGVHQGTPPGRVRTSPAREASSCLERSGSGGAILPPSIETLCYSHFVDSDILRSGQATRAFTVDAHSSRLIYPSPGLHTVGSVGCL